MTNITLTQEYLQTIFDYKDGFLIRKVRNGGRARIGEIAGYIHKGSLKDTPRRKIGLMGRDISAARLIFLWHKGWLPSHVDHKNRNSLDDRIKNLRATDSLGNSQNRTSAKNSTSKYLGVHLTKNKRWMVQIHMNGKQRYLGVYHCEKQAALTYNKGALIHHGEFANLNIID